MDNLTQSILVVVVSALTASAFSFFFGRFSSTATLKHEARSERLRKLYSPYVCWLRQQSHSGGAFAYTTLDHESIEHFNALLFDNYDCASPLLKTKFDELSMLTYAYSCDPNDKQLAATVDRVFIELSQTISAEYDVLCRGVYFYKRRSIRDFLSPIFNKSRNRKRN